MTVPARAFCLWMFLHRCLALRARSWPDRYGKRGFRLMGEECWDADVWNVTDAPLTNEMCSKSRPYRSSSQASHPVIAKLHNKECITVAALGGSVTFGNCEAFPPWMWLPDREQVVWPAQLAKWLNQKFPCGEPGGHTVHNLAGVAVDSKYWADQIASWRREPSHPLWEADVIFFDSNLNDVQNNMEQYPIATTGSESSPKAVQAIRENTEKVVRALKGAPRDPWIVWAELSWETKGKDNHWDAEWMHLPVLRHYDVDQVSLLDGMLPITEEKSKWLQATYFCGEPDHHHPGPLGHQMIAQTVGNALMEESAAMNQLPEEGGSRYTKQDDLPEPLYIDKTLANIYDTVRPQRVSFGGDASNAKGGKPEVLLREGFNSNGDSDAVDAVLQIGIPITYHEDRQQRLVNIGYQMQQALGAFQTSYAVAPGGCPRAPVAAGDLTPGRRIVTWWGIPFGLRMSRSMMVDVKDPSAGCLVLQFKTQDMAVPFPYSGLKMSVNLLDVTVF